MNDVWYIRVRGEVRGPMPHEELLAQIRKKRLGRHHEVSRDGLQWQRAGEIPELFEPLIPVLQPAGSAVPSAAPGTSSAAAGDIRHDPGAFSAAGTTSRETVWFYAKGGSRNGPIAETELLALIRAGQLEGSDLVWNEQLESWTPLRQIPRLSTTAAPAQPLIVPREHNSLPASPLAVPPLLTSSLFAVLFACLSLLAIPLIFVLSAVISGSETIRDAMAGQSGSAGAGMLAVLITAAMFGAMPLFSAAAGVFTGHHSLKVHKQSPGAYTGAGYALTALILCYAILAITFLVLIVCVIVAGVKSA
ncbi:MAG: DUF4339 domain-containing protein [Planctomycetota bacterium]